MPAMTKKPPAYLLLSYVFPIWAVGTLIGEPDTWTHSQLLCFPEKIRILSGLQFPDTETNSPS